MKNITIVVAGSGKILDCAIKPGTTPRDINEKLKERLPGHCGFSPGEGEKFFGENENIYPLVKDGQKIYATSKADVGGFCPPPLFFISAVILGFIPIFSLFKRRKNEGIVAGKNSVGFTISPNPLTSQRIVIGHRKPIVIKRIPTPYWKEQGWKKATDGYRGYYRTKYGSWYGVVVNPYSNHFEFYIYNPPPQLQRHPHWQCFVHQGNRWYIIHFSVPPKDISSGIIQIERIIHESFAKNY